ncbi:unnamed protein product [Rotaria magnacalcarata]|uniref:Uncharacterized protein n=1 Tax=Rotaria magnacalcarata TaxID=392030 RepID=A0A815G287_9BILA|nr:unnamed protein product [Rotaria magnacalcarata]CAF1525368.1 unnamed protein product [Rotaria magnacalcarata]CAF2078790.1 unnamed protein product [Rotaria magnacalcarata]CAF4894597.1 unnamed protein product [Rotaria magnacalcarata]CAF5015089.1 unnamed protein product [Rotaria magnacalcarata]
MSSLSLSFIWLDRRNGNLPGGNQKLKEKFRKLLSPIRQFDKPTSFLDSIESSLKDRYVLFLTSDSFADEEFLNKIASLPNVYRIYIYNQQENNYQMDDINLAEKMGSERIIQFDEQLYKQIILDLIKIYSKESDQAGQGKQAKELFEFAVQLINTIDDQDEDLQQMEKYLLSRISYFK